MPIDYKNYHPKWKLISRLIRFRRANSKCENCFAENYKPHPVTGSKVILTVAHLDRDRTNNRFWNLAALCQRCHLSHDINQHVFNRKYGRNWKDNQYSFLDQLKPAKSNNYEYGIKGRQIRMAYDFEFRQKSYMQKSRFLRN